MCLALVFGTVAGSESSSQQKYSQGKSGVARTGGTQAHGKPTNADKDPYEHKVSIHGHKKEMEVDEPEGKNENRNAEGRRRKMGSDGDRDAQKYYNKKVMGKLRIPSSA